MPKFEWRIACLGATVAFTADILFWLSDLQWLRVAGISQTEGRGGRFRMDRHVDDQGTVGRAEPGPEMGRTRRSALKHQRVSLSSTGH